MSVRSWSERAIVVVILALILGHIDPPSCWAQDKPTLDLDVVYGKAADRELKLDLARPAGKGPFATVVCVHGGGWRLGNKRGLRGWIELLAPPGHVAASAGYRLAPGSTFPSHIAHWTSAVRFIPADADRSGMD